MQESLKRWLESWERMTRNEQAESNVLGAVLQYGELLEDLTLKPEHFQTRETQLIYNAMTQVFKRGVPVDVTTVASELGDELKSVGDVTYLVDLASSVPSTKNLKYYQRLVYQAYQNKAANEQASEFLNNGKAEDLPALASEIQRISELGRDTGQQSVGDTLLEIASDIMSGEKNVGFKTGLNDLDFITGGLQRSDLIIFGARPSVGKTALALNLAVGHCRNGGTSNFFSAEMPIKKLLHRLISIVGNIDQRRWLTMEFSKEDYDRSMNAITEITNWNINIFDDIVTPKEIKSKTKELIKQAPEENHLVLIDFLTELKPDTKNINRSLEVGEMASDVKSIARDYNIPVVLLAQLNRKATQRDEKRPTMADLRDSGEIEQIADAVGLLHRDSYYDNSEEGSSDILEIILDKHRNGATGTVEVAFQKEYGKMHSLERRYEE